MPANQAVYFVNVAVYFPYVDCGCSIIERLVVSMGEIRQSRLSIELMFEELVTRDFVRAFADEYRRHSFRPINLAEHAFSNHYSFEHMELDYDDPEAGKYGCLECHLPLRTRSVNSALLNCSRCCKECQELRGKRIEADAAYAAWIGRTGYPPDQARIEG